MGTLNIATAMQHADTLASRYDPAAHLYLDLAEAMIEGPDERVYATREACIAWEIKRYRTCPPCARDCPGCGDSIALDDYDRVSREADAAIGPVRDDGERVHEPCGFCARCELVVDHDGCSGPGHFVCTAL